MKDFRKENRIKPQLPKELRLKFNFKEEKIHERFTKLVKRTLRKSGKQQI